MRTRSALFLLLLAMLLPGVSSNAFAKYTEQWVSNAELARKHPDARPAKAAQAVGKKPNAKSQNAVVAKNDDDPIAAFARPTSARRH